MSPSLRVLVMAAQGEKEGADAVHLFHRSAEMLTKLLADHHHDHFYHGT